MKQKKRAFIVAFMLGVGTTIYAEEQPILNLFMKENFTKEYLRTNSLLTFKENGDLNLKNGTTDTTIAFINLQKITFGKGIIANLPLVKEGKPELFFEHSSKRLFVKNLLIQGSTNVDIFNLNGDKLLSKSYSTNEAIDVRSLKQGIYIVRINNLSLKFVVK